MQRVALQLSKAFCCIAILAFQIDGLRAQDASLPRVIFNNDMTNFDGIFMRSPPTNPSDVVASVRDGFDKSLRYGLIPGVDAQSLSVGYSTFPWWHSKLYSLADHDRFLRSLSYYSSSVPRSGYPGKTPSASRTYVEQGNDFVRDFLRAALTQPNGTRQTRILNFRVNDAHYTYNYDIYKSKTLAQIQSEARSGQSPLCDARSPDAIERIEYWTQTSFTAFYEAFVAGVLPPELDHRCVSGSCISRPEFSRQCSDRTCVLNISGSQCPTVVLNFSKPVVRQFKKLQLAEIVSEYSPGILELDFDRFPHYFDNNTALRERTATMTNWLKEIRTDLIKTNNIKLGIRVPSKKAHRAAIGIDLQELDRQGLVDYAILAMPYYFDQQTDVELNPKASSMKLYSEITHETGAPDPALAPLKLLGLEANAPYREFPTTPRQLKTAAHLAYQQGLHGIAFFNMHYYLRLASNVPPLQLPTQAVTCATEPQCAAQSDQEYFLSSTHYHLQATADMLQFRLSSAKSSHQFNLTMIPPSSGWGDRGLLTMSFVLEGNAANGQQVFAIYERAAASLRVQINGSPVMRGDDAWPDDRQEAPPNRAHLQRIWWLQKPFTATFSLPSRYLRRGNNEVNISYQDTSGAPLRIIGFRVYVPAKDRTAADR